MKKKIVFAVCFVIVLFLCGCELDLSESAVSDDWASAQSSAEQSKAVSGTETEEISSAVGLESSAESSEESSEEPAESNEESSEEPAESSEESSEEPAESSEESSEEPDESSEESSEEPAESSEESSEEPVESSEESSEEPAESSEESSEEPAESSEESSEEPDESSEESSDEPDESSEESSEETSTESSEEEVYDIGDAEVLPSGYLIYNGAAYSVTYFSESATRSYADVYAAYVKQFPDVGIHVINPPLAAFNITNPAVAALVNDQEAVLRNMQAMMYGGVNFVPVADVMGEHRGEYLYFRSDYHWTQLGAYYAYVAFADSVGITPTPLETFEKRIIVDSWIGRTNDYANDNRINSFYDTVYAYMPTKQHTMAVYDANRNLLRLYENCIQPSIKNYSCFITGDQAFTVINVPENDQDKTVLVIKDSSANAFVPYLTEHYGNIIVVDPRMYTPKVSKLIAEFGIDDIIFFTMASTANRSGYDNYYRAMLG